MARTESKVLTCHPRDEQEVIDAMQKFHWSLLNTQEVNVVDSHLQKGSWGDDNIYSVTKKAHYVKLSFYREIDMPHLNEIRKLEAAYLGLPSPQYPSFLIHLVLCVVLVLIGELAMAVCTTGVVNDFLLFGAHELIPAVLLIGIGIGIVVAVVIWRWYWHCSSYRRKRDAAKQIAESNAQRRKEILAEVEKYN